MSKAPKTKVTKTSKCNCGSVEFSVTGVDKGAVLCHCANCKRSAGSKLNISIEYLLVVIVPCVDMISLVPYIIDNSRSGAFAHNHRFTNGELQFVKGEE